MDEIINRIREYVKSTEPIRSANTKATLGKSLSDREKKLIQEYQKQKLETGDYQMVGNERGVMMPSAERIAMSGLIAPMSSVRAASEITQAAPQFLRKTSLLDKVGKRLNTPTAYGLLAGTGGLAGIRIDPKGGELNPSYDIKSGIMGALGLPLMVKAILGGKKPVEVARGPYIPDNLNPAKTAAYAKARGIIEPARRFVDKPRNFSPLNYSSIKDIIRSRIDRTSNIEKGLAQNTGWKNEGQKQAFDFAIFSKDANTLQKLLPTAPEWYKSKFAPEIEKVLGGGKVLGASTSKRGIVNRWDRAVDALREGEKSDFTSRVDLGEYIKAQQTVSDIVKMQTTEKERETIKNVDKLISLAQKRLKAQYKTR